MTASTATRARRVPQPRLWGLRAVDAYAFAALNALIIAAMWVRHGGLHQLATTAGTLMAIGQLAALYGTLMALIQLVLISRSPYLDQVFGTDRLLWLHRWGGFATVWLLVGHFAFTTMGYGMGDGSGPIAEFVTFLTVYPWVLWAAVALALFVTVAVTSVRASRRALPYGAWYAIHLLMYAAIALGFMHQLLVGSDFVRDPVARLYWIGLYALTIGSILVWRVGLPLTLYARHRFRVASVIKEAPGVVSIYLTGRDLDRLAVRAGQWFVLRFLTREGWYRAHPFSISSAPNGKYLRITVKALGDHTQRLQYVRVGTSVFAEGPYGILTGARRTKGRVVLIAGGIGITPLRALLEELPAAPGNLTLIYRTSRPADLVFRQELDTLAGMRGARIHYVVGRRGSPQVPSNPLKSSALRSLVPDIDRCDVYVCGPDAMMDTVHRALRILGVPDSQVHSERFAY
jgi:predicted ferric reductase